MCWMTVLLAMYLKAGCAASVVVEDGSVEDELEEVLSIRDLRMVCWEGWVSISDVDDWT